jgi:hypothetical protein
MSAVNLYINEEKVSYEIRQDVIVIKEKGNVIFEVPIPNGYHLLGILDEGNNKKNIVITPYELKKPNYIPEGYGNLHLICEGCWEIDEKDKTLYLPRHLHYVDTTLLKPEHYLEESDGQFQISQEEIPKSFWFSDQHRDLMAEILDDSYYIPWVEINKIPEYLKGFDPRCRLITEEECLSLFAFNEATDFCFKGYTKLTGIKPQYDSLPKFVLGGNEYYIENWDKIVLSRENRGVYKQLLNKLAHPDGIYRSRLIPSFITNDLRYPNFTIPVIDEEAGKKVLVK